MLKYFRVLAHEIRMNLAMSKAYKFSFLIDIAIFFAILAFVIISDSGYKLSVYYSNDSESKELLLIGYAMWILTISTINTISNEIRLENIQGTLEPQFMAIVPFQWLMIGKIISSLLIQAVQVIIIFILAKLVFNLSLTISLSVLPYMILTYIGMYGFSLVIGAIVLNKKKIGQLNLIIQVLLLFVSNVFTVLEIGLISKIIPLGIGNHLIRLEYLGLPITNNDLFLGVFICLLWLIIGEILFHKAILNVKTRGTLNLY